MTDNPKRINGRFPPKVSGNPKGRPKGAKNRKTEIEAELDETIPVSENGKRKKITKRKAFVKQLVNKAIAGDLRAAEILFKYAPQCIMGMMDAKGAERDNGNLESTNLAPASLTPQQTDEMYRKALRNAQPIE